jgi:Flp pilus assembly pilin Flp
MGKLSRSLRVLLTDENGFETVEYAILLGLLVAGSLAVITALGIWVVGIFTTVQSDLGA